MSKSTGMIYTFSKVGLFLDTPHLIYLRDVLFSFPIEEASSLLIFMVTVGYIAPEAEPIERFFSSRSLTMEYAAQPCTIFTYLMRRDTCSILLSAMAPLSRRDNRGGVQPSWLVQEKSYIAYLWLLRLVIHRRSTLSFAFCIIVMIAYIFTKCQCEA